MNKNDARSVIAIFTWLLLSSSILHAEEHRVDALVSALKSSDESARLLAIDRLGTLGNKAAEAVPPLVKLLKDDSAPVRAHAAHSLGQIGAPAKAAVADLAELVKDPESVVRRQAIDAILATGAEPEVTMPLMVKLLEGSDLGIRLRILNTLAETGPPAVPRLIGALKNDRAAYWACLVAQEMGPVAKDAIPALTQRIKDSRPEVRREAVLALGAMEKAASGATPQIAAALKDEHVAAAATYALGRIGKIPADVEPVVRRNAKGDDAMLSTISIWALSNCHPQDKQLRAQATEQLIGRLTDSDPFVRTAAARGLAALPPAPEITLAIWNRALSNSDETTLHYALDALARLGPPAVPRLVDALKYEKLRPHVLEVLRQLGPAAAPATQALAGLIDDQDEEVARSALQVLAAIGPAAKSAVPALLKALNHGDNSNSDAIVYALGTIGAQAAEAEGTLLSLLQDSNQDRTLIAAWALTKIKPSSAVAAKIVPVLVNALAAPLPVTRRGAAETLGNLGSLAKDAIPALDRASHDPHKSVRDAATQALASIRG
jgi:HEAT repeat protein